MVLYARLITRGNYLILEDGAHMQTADLAQGFQEALFGNKLYKMHHVRTRKENQNCLFGNRIW